MCTIYLSNSLIHIINTLFHSSITFICVCCAYSPDPEHKRLVERFKAEFAEYKCDKCACDCKNLRVCDCECPVDILGKTHCPSIWLHTAKKPQKMTTEEAKTSGAKTARLANELKDFRNQKKKPTRGLITKLKETTEREPFKDVSPFVEFFGLDWDMVRRIAVDPAHQFYNLAKDILALTGNRSNMALTKEYLAKERARGRFKDITLSKVPWHVSDKYKRILTLFLTTVKIPNGWPMLLNYFSDEYEKIKIAESLAFLGDIGCYFIDKMDITEEFKTVLIELIKVSAIFISKTTKPNELKVAHKKMVNIYNIQYST